MYHVTRQSFGVCKLYTKEISQIKYQENFIYIFNFIFFLIGFFRFYFPIINTNHIFSLNIIIVILIFTTLIIYFFRYKFSDSFYTFVTGINNFLSNLFCCKSCPCNNYGCNNALYSVFIFNSQSF
jgi:hypothetical protein